MKLESRFETTKLCWKLILMLPLVFILTHMSYAEMSVSLMAMMLLLFLLVAGLFGWQLSDTSCFIDERFLHYRSGSRREKIEVSTIQTVRKPVSWKAAADASRSLSGYQVFSGMGSYS
jgi:hypothetical protein